MATKKAAITVTISKALDLTSKEIGTLKKAFKTDVTRVIKARSPSGSPAPFPDVNVGAGAAGASRKRSAKKSAKAGSSKKK